MGIDLNGMLSDWMTVAVLGMTVVSVLLLGVCSATGLCACAEQGERRAEEENLTPAVNTGLLARAAAAIAIIR